MIKVIGLLLGLFFTFLIYIYYRKDKDLLSPNVLFLILEFVAYVPGMFLFEMESSIPFTVEGCVKVFFFEILYVCAFLFGVGFSKRFYIKEDKRTTDASMMMIFLFFLIGLAAKVIVIIDLGGLAFVLQHQQYAYLMQSHGYGIYTMFYKFMVLAILAMFEKWTLHKEKKIYLVLLIVMIAIYAASFLIYTNRTPALILALIALFIYNYKIKKLNIKRLFNIRFLAIFAICIALSYTATIGRTKNSNDVSDSAIEDLFYNLTCVGRDIKVYDYFSENEKWLGRGYLNIIPSLIPGVESKPSTDDGIYLTNIIRGYTIDINDHSDQLPSQTGSVPFSSPGYMYANFGALGIFFGGIIEGLVTGLAFKLMKRRTNAFYIAIYFYMVYSFGLSTGKMVPTMISIVFILVFRYFIAVKVTARKKTKIQPLPTRISS